MFHRYSKKKAKILKELTRISSPEQLFSDKKRREVQEKIQNLLLIDSDLYSKMVIPLYDNLVNYCQYLPDSIGNCHTHPAGLIDHALLRTEAALRLFQNYFISDENASASHEQKLWQYTLFTAAMLQGISKLQLDYTVHLFDENGNFLEIWNPILKPLVAVGNHYNYVFNKQSVDASLSSLNTLLAHLLMPPEGFKWIASNDEVLMVWLSLLSDEFESSGTLGAILGRAEMIASRQLLFMIRENLINQPRFNPGAFIDSPVVELSTIEQQIGLEFIDWLHQRLADENYVINQDELVITTEGMLLNTNIFKDFTNDKPHINLQAAKQGFMALGLHQIIAGGRSMTRFEQAKYQQVNSVLVFERYGIALPETLALYNKTTNKTTAVKAVELSKNGKVMPLPAINSKGDWVQLAQEPNQVSHHLMNPNRV